jgi:hypothetical protein
MLTDTAKRRKRGRQNFGRENAADEPENDDVRAEGRRRRHDPACALGAQWLSEKRGGVLQDSLWLAYSAARVLCGVGATAPMSCE